MRELPPTGPPVIVLGVARSGTTLLKETLNHHSQLAIPSESYFLMPLWDRFRAGRDLERLLVDLRYVVQIREWGIEVEDIRARLPANADFPDVIRSIYECYAHSRGKPRFGDKTPLYVLELDLLEHAFSRPMYVHIVRDVRDAALSFVAMPEGPPKGWMWPRGILDFGCRWRRQVGATRRFGAGLGAERYVELRYEDLVAEPEITLREVCRRIGLSYEDSMLEYHRDVDLRRFPNQPRLAEPPSPAKGNWRERMRRADVERMEAVAGDLLEELRYERAFPRPTGPARARALVAGASSRGRSASIRACLPIAHRTPVWRWKQSQALRRDGFPMPVSTAPGGLILMFHAIDDGPAPGSFPPDLFARGMEILHEKGYRAIPLVDLAACLRAGIPPPERTFVLTFDDGYRSVCDHALPILARYGWTATVFLVTDSRTNRAEPDSPRAMSGRRLLGWREIDEMQAAGVSFGAHTLTHPDLTTLSPDRAEEEIAGSRAALEEALEVPVRAFAYPYGRFNEATREIVRRNFECACSDRLGIAGPGSDLYALERVDAHYLRREAIFAAIPSRRFSLYVRARSVPRRLRRAVRRRRAAR